jgi:hypothetical protein
MDTPLEVLKNHYIPPYGTYVVFEIDPEATFRKYDCPVDHEAAKEIEDFPRKTYVGFVYIVRICALSKIPATKLLISSSRPTGFRLLTSHSTWYTLRQFNVA